MSRDPKSSYYDAGAIETIQIIKAKLTAGQFEGFCKGSILKYVCRSGFKGLHTATNHSEELEIELRDLEKAEFYLRWLIEERSRYAESIVDGSKP